MNSMENYWEEVAERAGKVEVRPEAAKEAGWEAHDLVGEHKQGCKCSYCDPVEDDMLDKSRPAANAPNGAEYAYDWTCGPRCEDAKPGDENYYQGMEGEELEQFANYVKAADKCLPPLKHPEIADKDKLGEALSKYYTFIEAKKTEMDQPFLKGILVFYIDVGQLSPEKAEAHIDRMKDRVKEVTDRIPPAWDVLWLPQRCQPTRIEVIRLDG